MRYLILSLVLVLLFAVSVTAQAPVTYYKTGPITVTATCTDPPFADGTPGSGCVKVRVSFDGGTAWTAWQTFPAVATWNGTFSGALKAGKNTIKGEYVDDAGNIGVSSRDVYADADPPVGSLTIAGG